MHLPEFQIKLLQEYFEDKPVFKVYLFGSYARGEADEESDIDLLAELDYDAFKSAWDYFDMSEELPHLLNKKVDFASKLSEFVINQVEKDKILIYEKGKRGKPSETVAH
jgi:uncharacterized protein